MRLCYNLSQRSERTKIVFRDGTAWEMGRNQNHTLLEIESELQVVRQRIPSEPPGKPKERMGIKAISSRPES